MSEVSDFSDELIASVAMSLAPGFGPRLQQRLLEYFGTPVAALNATHEQLLAIEGVGGKTAQAFRGSELRDQALRLLSECRTEEVALLHRSESRAYPVRLKEICDAPLVLYMRGALLPQDDLAIGIVGSRRCTTYGRRQAERLAAQLSRAGLTVVSGLARGVDQSAHVGALNSGGRTIAVLAGGVTRIYPPEHEPLAAEIVQQGALLSEMPLHQRILPGLFPQRNRIISGLCVGIIVVEATRNSGALYTARHALEQGRDVFAVPGPIDSLASVGCHDLIRDGVTLIRSADDVLEALGPLPVPSQVSQTQTIHSPRELVLNPMESRVLNLIGTQPVAIDEILREGLAESSQILATLTVLEVRRMVRRLPGNFVVRHD